ncbi:Chaperone_protein DnaJ [Hexamita inflata]
MIKQLQCFNTSVFLNNKNIQAHQRLCNIYRNSAMYQEAEKSYIILAGNSINDDIKECRIQMNKYVINYRQVLNLDSSVQVDSDQFNRAYKKACSKWHPDRFINDPSIKKFAEFKFKQIQDARTALSK